MVAVTPVRLGEPCGRLAFGGARLPSVQNPSETYMTFRTHVTHYLVAPAEPWPSVCHILRAGKALGNMVGLALPLILQLITRSAAARRAQRGKSSRVDGKPGLLLTRFGHSGASPHQRQTPNVT